MMLLPSMTRPLPSPPPMLLAILVLYSSPRIASSFRPLALRTVVRSAGSSSPSSSFGLFPGFAACPTRPDVFTVSASTDSASASASASSSSEDTDSTLASLYGGDYAGLSATFSSSSGELIRVPEHLVPDSMIEWGQIPSCLEVLTSEDFVDGDEADGGTVRLLERKVASVMPEVGCGVDNLDVMRTEETFVVSSASPATTTFGTGVEVAAAAAAALSRPMPPLRDAERIRIETAFPLPPEIVEQVAEGEEEEEGGSGAGAEEEESYPRRVRVSFDVIPSTKTVFSPITVVRERQTSSQSSGGTIGLGGGLDGRTVTRLVGKGNVNKPFAETEGVEGPADVESREGFIIQSLPGDVVVRIGTKKEGREDDDEEWTVDVGLVSQQPEGKEEENGQKMLRVIRWAFSMDDSGAAVWSTELITEEC